jgi:hypothetical protein
MAMEDLTRTVKNTVIDGVGSGVGIWVNGQFIEPTLGGAIAPAVGTKLAPVVSDFVIAAALEFAAGKISHDLGKDLARAAAAGIFGLGIAKAFGFKDPPLKMAGTRGTTPSVPQNFGSLSPVALTPIIA